MNIILHTYTHLHTHTQEYTTYNVHDGYIFIVQLLFFSLVYVLRQVYSFNVHITQRNIRKRVTTVKTLLAFQNVCKSDELKTSVLMRSLSISSISTDVHSIWSSLIRHCIVFISHTSILLYTIRS